MYFVGMRAGHFSTGDTLAGENLGHQATVKNDAPKSRVNVSPLPTVNVDP